MSKRQATPLSIPGIPRKGEAEPALRSLEAPVPTEPRVDPAVAPAVSNGDLPAVRLSSRVQATIAVTVRLDERRYERMKTWGVGRRVTNQEIIVAALDHIFSLNDDDRERAIAALRR